MTRRKAQRARAARYPIGTVALYGPDDKITTKIVAGVKRHPDAEPILRQWVGSAIIGDPKVSKGITEFFRENGVTQVIMTEGNLGCPHEEGLDFPVGGDCPFCAFWKGKQGSGRKE